MNAFALHLPSARFAGTRWAASAAVITALHVGLIAIAVSWYRHDPPSGTDAPAILVDMTPVSAAPEIQPADEALGPEMQQADAPTPPEQPPEPMRQSIVEDQIAATPPVEKPVVEAPSEVKEQPSSEVKGKPSPEVKDEPTQPLPQPPRIVPDPPKPMPENPKPVRAKARKKPRDEPPAPRSNAPPRADRRGRAATAATAGAAAAAAALPSYRDRLAAHLQRYKQYPGEAKAAGQQGVAMLSFTVNRSGQVLASRLAGSSGVSALDAETLAMIRRAQPLPPFPPEIAQSSLSFTVPVRFSIR